MFTPTMFSRRRILYDGQGRRRDHLFNRRRAAAQRVG
eukprot:CAMPEP_0116917728 /NCGR_PEP_ID=MMETSP0467-20121206/19330_1 /TAXON_ID=283647 /ORGANISM="Mesodinium pulex, Strain SPMC105" /LENGTH=36 /DNA_ID= /DNA_START= /DNA_END= /DNA_ORIENTATION=